MARRNSSIIGPKKAPSNTNAPGIHDMFNVYNYKKNNIFPNSVSAVITVNPTQYNEGSTIIFNITTYDFPSGTLYVRANNVSQNSPLIDTDFSSPTRFISDGSTVTISSSSGQFVLVMSNDSLADGTDVFNLSFHLFSTGGPLVGRSADITILDTSNTPPPPTITNIGASGANLGSGAYIQAYTVASSDEVLVTVNTPFPIIFLGQSFTRLGIHSNSYIMFGSSTTTFPSPFFVFQATNPAQYAIGVSAASWPAEGQDTGVDFIGYRTVGSNIFEIYWQGYYPWYSAGTSRDINGREWKCIFNTTDNSIIIETYRMPQEGSSPGNRIRLKTNNSFVLVNGEVTAYNTRYRIA